MDTVRWNLAVSAEIDRKLRMFLASQGGGRKGDLSRFIEEAVRCYILEQSAKQAKLTNAELSEETVSGAVEEALTWARRS
ncbi:ribbon-helix-helix domain-containing protein [Pseudomonas sp. DC3000-4b1]|uniref:ribbon-helix-helix domain-containing protein n=1 Tax=unclassified Pseudomonas TaxID=196821 RepID=UPI003CE697B2